MIEFIISFLNNRIEQLSYFKTVNGLVEQVRKNVPDFDEDGEESGTVEQTYPAQYDSKGNYKNIDLQTYETGLVYHREVEPSTQGQGEGESAVACDEQILRTYNMRLVFFVSKRILGVKNDTNNIDNEIANNLQNLLNITNNKELTELLGVDSVSVSPILVNTDRYEVFDDEFVNVRMNMQFEYILAAIDYTVEIEGLESCFQDFTCEGMENIVFDEQKLPSSLGKVKVSGNDKTLKYLADKIKSADGSVLISVTNEGQDECLDLKVVGGGGSIPFDWDRPITTLPFIGQNLGALITTLEDGIEFIYFGFVPATLSLNSFPLAEIGDDITPQLIGILDINSETTPTVPTVLVNGGAADTFTVNAPPANTNINQAAPSNITVNTTYQLRLNVDNNGSPTQIFSALRTQSFIYPFFHGVDSDGNLTGNTLYTTLTKLLETQGNKMLTFNGANEYIYFCYPDTYPDLVSILDENNFEVISAFTKFTRSVTSSGLPSNYTQDFKVYRSTNLLVIINNLDFTFKFS